MQKKNFIGFRDRVLLHLLRFSKEVYENIHGASVDGSYREFLQHLTQEGIADVEFWGQVVKAWVGVGYNPINVLGMLDCYRRGELPSTAPSSAAGSRRRGPPSKLQSTIETGIRILKQEGEWPT